MRKFYIEKEYKGYTASKYLTEVQEYSSRSIRAIDIYLDGKKIKPNKKLRPYNKLLVYEKEKGTNIKAMEMDLDIVYEDQDLLIINKEPFIVVHPTLKKVDKTLANGIVYHFQKNNNLSIVPRFYNRLDMNTSGLIIITKNSYSQAYLQEKCEVKKCYKAIVKGIVKEDEFIIEEAIGRIGDSLRRELIDEEHGGQYAKTAVKVIERLEDEKLTLVECELFTGRTHQIRVHLSSKGHPILGDELYDVKDKRANRQLLHAYKIQFKNPSTKQIQNIEIDLPKDMKTLLVKE